MKTYRGAPRIHRKFYHPFQSLLFTFPHLEPDTHPIQTFLLHFTGPISYDSNLQRNRAGSKTTTVETVQAKVTLPVVQE